MYLTTLFFFFLYCQHQLSTYIHIKIIYLYIVVPVNCGPGKYISLMKKESNSYQQIVLPPTQVKGTDLLKMWDAAVENQ